METYIKEHLIECKKKLYAALLHIDPENYTDSEATLMFNLSNDPDIQSSLEKARGNPNAKKI